MLKRLDRPLIAILIFGLAARFITALYLGDEALGGPGTADQLSYHTLALRVLNGHGFSFPDTWWPLTPADAPTAHWSYLYTLYLAVVYALFGATPIAARLFQGVIVGLAQPILAYWLGHQLFGRRVGLIAAGLTAAYTYFIYYSVALMTEAFYITALLASFVLAIQLVRPSPRVASPKRQLRLALALGACLGAAALLRQVVLLFVPFLFTWMWWSGGGERRKAIFVSATALALIIVPITAINYARFGRFVLLNTNSGFAFFWANHPIYGTRFEPILPPSMGSYQALIPPDLRSLDEAALDQALLRRGIQFVLDDPGRYLLLSLSRIPTYFMFWPSEDSGLVSNIARVASFGLVFPLTLYGLLRSLRRNHAAKFFRPSSLLLSFALIYTAIHVLSWALIRYRLPIDAALMPFAGSALSDLSARIANARRPVTSAA